MPEYPDRKPYKLTQVNIPLGVGLKYYASERINLSAEVLYRKTFTDYIDDVSHNYIDPVNYNKHLSAADELLSEIESTAKSLALIKTCAEKYFFHRKTG